MKGMTSQSAQEMVWYAADRGAGQAHTQQIADAYVDHLVASGDLETSTVRGAII